MSEINEPKRIDWRNHISTGLGAIVAIANAWVNIDFTTFAFDKSHMMPLCISACIALGGYFTSINK